MRTIPTPRNYSVSHIIIYLRVILHFVLSTWIKTIFQNCIWFRLLWLSLYNTSEFVYPLTNKLITISGYTEIWLVGYAWKLDYAQNSKRSKIGVLLVLSWLELRWLPTIFWRRHHLWQISKVHTPTHTQYKYFSRTWRYFSNICVWKRKLLTLQSLKYFPVTCSTSSSTAR